MSGQTHRLTDFQLDKPSIVSIGVFDGVHIGHQRLVDRLVAEAKASHRTSIVLTFFPHPDVVLRGVSGRYYLTTSEERARRLKEMGVDLVITHDFSEAISRIRAAAFVEQLHTHLKMSALWVGEDFALGYKREGDVAFLRTQGQMRGFEVETVNLKMGNKGEVISSSRVRKALSDGDVEQAAEWLGRSFRIGGIVVDGDHRGRTIGFPTANVETWDEQLLPGNGVYACWSYVEGARWPSVVNIGVQPTFDGARLKVEAHLLDFNRDIYGQHMRLEFVRRLRPERRFKGVDELIAQIHQDANAGRELLNELARREQG